MPKKDTAVPRAVHERHEKLKQAIDHHRYLYHVLDREEISPAALDSLKRELGEIEAEYPSLITPDSPSQRVAGTPLPEFRKVEHSVSQWSFNDAFTEEDMRAFDARVKRFLRGVAPTYSAELKIDGLKVVLTYEKGSLTLAATRGDGVVGEDVTHNVRTIESVPLSLRSARTLVAEGEVWMGKKTLAALNTARAAAGEPPFANPRNAAAGAIRQLDPKVAAARKLDTFFYDLASYDGLFPDTQTAELELLRELGFKVNTHFRHCPTIDDVVAYWEEWRKRAPREDYLIDGVVVKVEERVHQQALGYTGKAPRFAIAFKFPAEQVTTVLERIAFQVGRTGVITPVAHLTPVSVAGSVVSRATLHNEDEIKRLDVREGDTVILQKAGDVIPDIVSVISELRPRGSRPFVFPERVLECGGEGKIERPAGQAAWRCVNRNSFVQQKRRLAYFVSKQAFNIVGLGPKIIDSLLEHGLIGSPDDIFTLRKGDLLALPRFAEKSVDNLLAAIERALDVTLSRLITALSIDHVGEETARTLAGHFGSLPALRAAHREELEGVPGVGEVVARSLFEWFRDPAHRAFLDRLASRVRIRNEAKPSSARATFAGVTFVLTGTLSSLTRAEAKERIRSRGGDVSGSVSAKTSYVVAGADPGVKHERARALGIRVLNEAEFLKMAPE